jgi:translation initiation factor 4E
MSESNLPLPFPFTLYFRIIDKRILSENNLLSIDYKESLKTIGSFDTVEKFWKIFQHVKKPEQYKFGLELLLFKDPIKPMWEDEHNKNGGRMSFKLKKESTSLIWEELILSFISNSFPEAITSRINGLTLTMRREFNFLQIWFTNYTEQFGNEIETTIRQMLSAPNDVEIDVKPFK